MSHQAVIAVGVDETQHSRRALTWAAREALRRGATLQVITAWGWESTEDTSRACADPAVLLSRAEQTQAAALHDVVDQLPERPTITHQIFHGTAAEALVRASQLADLVVVGTHGRGPVRALLLGSVSMSVIKHAACPVVVMPPVHPESESRSPHLSISH